METLEIEKKLKDIILQHTGADVIEEITEDTSIRNDLGADSLDQLEIVMAVEKEFSIEIDDHLWDSPGVDSLNQLKQVIELKLK